MRIYIAATHKSSGKTVVTVGLASALEQLKFSVQTFKKGPDYIDSNWLARATAKPCFNLDFYSMSKVEITSQFNRPQAQIKLIEGNKGLFDGLSLDGKDSNAALANLLKTPVVLVINCEGITRGIAPLLQGYQNFTKPKVKIARVILNKVGGSRHQAKLIAATETYTDLKVLGAVPKLQTLQIAERHLGLIPSNETTEANKLISEISNIVADNVHLDFFRPKFEVVPTAKVSKTVAQKYDLTIAVAKDSAFGFYYAEDLLLLEQLVKKVIYFSPLLDDNLPDNINGLFLGGGFPETHATQIEANFSMLQDLQSQIKQGLPTYAECGGMMILTNSITYQNKTYKMAGVIDADCLMQTKPQGRGYVSVVPNTNHIWQMPTNTVKAHEFHYSKLSNLTKPQNFAYQVIRGVGIENQHDGICDYNLLANYLHLKHSLNTPWLDYFLKFCAEKNVSNE